MSDFLLLPNEHYIRKSCIKEVFVINDAVNKDGVPLYRVVLRFNDDTEYRFPRKYEADNKILLDGILYALEAE